MKIGHMAFSVKDIDNVDLEVTVNKEKNTIQLFKYLKDSTIVKTIKLKSKEDYDNAILGVLVELTKWERLHDMKNDIGKDAKKSAWDTAIDYLHKDKPEQQLVLQNEKNGGLIDLIKTKKTNNIKNLPKTKKKSLTP